MSNKLCLRILSGNIQAPNSDGLSRFYNSSDLRIEGIGLYHQWSADSGELFLFFGESFLIKNNIGVLEGTSLKSRLEELNYDSLRCSVEGRYVLVCIFQNECRISSDSNGSAEIYWKKLNGGYILASSLDLLMITEKSTSIDNIGLTHSLIVYGSRPAKKHTLYSMVNRLGIKQTIVLSGGVLDVIEEKFNPLKSVPEYKKSELDRYSEILIEAIRARSSINGNVVYLSSGWDSTSILAVLVHLHGNRKVRAVIGRMRFSDRSGVINQFEIDRATKVADYYGIRLDIAELDYRSEGPELIDLVRPLMRSQQLAALTSINHMILAKKVKETSNGNEVIFAGEISDGAHNLGFSQFTTIFHPSSQSFREYSDKMASYLYGPTFLKELISGNYSKDPIWQIMKSRNENIVFDNTLKDVRGVTLQLLSSFFLRPGRLPLYSISNTKMLTPFGAESYVNNSERIYIDPYIDNVNTENLYAHYLHLYKSFHWQGATVTSLEYTAEAEGLSCILPFQDQKMLDFLSAMPESWGRGLELEPTKYPLKWFLANKIDYPMHLQVGPHSYTYDIDPTFSLAKEIFLHSSLAASYKKVLSSKQLIGKMDPEHFNLDYVNSIVDRHLRGDLMQGSESLDLISIANHELVGTY